MCEKSHKRDGQYYRLGFSIGLNLDVATVYNVGKRKEITVPAISIAIVGSKARGAVTSNRRLPQDTAGVNTHSMQNSEFAHGNTLEKIASIEAIPVVIRKCISMML